MTTGPQATGPKKPYNEVKSDFIREKIKKKDFDNIKDREYVHALIAFEEYILGNFNPGYPGGMFFSSKKTELEEEYETIYKEIKPEKWEKKQKEKERKRKQRAKERQERIQKKRRELDKSRQQWEKVK